MTWVYRRTLQVSLAFRSFRPDGEISSLMSATTNRSLMERQTSRGISANSAMPTVLSDARTRNSNSRRITSVTLSTWSEIRKSMKRQVLTWLLLWCARVSDPAYAHIWSPRWDRQPPYSKESKLSPTQRSPPTRLIAAGPHHNPASTTIAAPPITVGRFHGVATVVGTPAATASRIVDVVRK